MGKRDTLCSGFPLLVQLIILVASISMPFPFLQRSSFAMAAPVKQQHASSSVSYDLIVVGGGSAGLTAAKFAAGTLSKSVCIVEQAKLGGDCTWTGCVPSKSLLASAKAAQLVRKHAISSTTSTSTSTSTAAGNTVDFESIQQRYRRIQQEIYQADDSPEALSKFGVDTLEGAATLTGPKTLRITSSSSSDDGTTEQEYTAKEGILLCTGALPREVDIAGIQNVNFVTYETIWDLERLPKQLTVVGGGPIGCELAQAFARLGSKVTMIVSDRLLPREEPEVSEILQDIFQNDEGIEIVFGRLQSVEKKNNSGHTATTTTGATVSGDCLLLSVGRTPNTKGLGLEALGIELNEKGGIAVNDKLQTSVDTIYAAGDCTGDRQL
jgi:pyruvate/2-oxoglutarate dehydrogenase complex dihydrolipoamide dehydrogenase (E3) component